MQDETINQSYIDMCVDEYKGSLRKAAKELGITPLKLRKVLITAGVYRCAMATNIQGLSKQGMSVEEIANELGMSCSNVYTYLPYKNVIYNLEEKSSTAKRQERYRERRHEKAELEEDLLDWLRDHPSIVDDLRRRKNKSGENSQKGGSRMLERGHVIDVNEAIKLYEKYNVEYKVMKRSGEVRAKLAHISVEFEEEIKHVLDRIGADGIWDHPDVLEDRDKKKLLVLSPYHGEVTEEMQEEARNCGFDIEYSDCFPYMNVNAIVIRKIW